MSGSGTLDFVAAGTLQRPGPLGRFVRLALGALCLYALWAIVQQTDSIVTHPYSRALDWAPFAVGPLCVFNYVVNIGFGRHWGQAPLMTSLAILLAVAGVTFVTTGDANSPVLGASLMLWLTYFYAHLGASFVVAAIIATPGCEMRAIPELIGRARGLQGAEHACPVALIAQIDAWERQRSER